MNAKSANLGQNNWMSNRPGLEQTIKQVITQAESTIRESETSRLDAELLIAHALDVTRAYLYTWPDKTLTTVQLDKIQPLIEQRAKGIPVAYLIGKREFWSLSLNVTADTLIPRPETELLVEAILDNLSEQDTKQVLDLGTGSGAIALAVAAERPMCQVIATDFSPSALRVAQKNAMSLKLSNLNFIQGDWLDAIGHTQFDIIVSNPPYIAEHDPHLAQGDVRYEPTSALVAKSHGLACLENIIVHAARCLKPGGMLWPLWRIPTA